MKSITLGESSLEDGVRTASTGGERKLMMTSWATLLKHMESRAIGSRGWSGAERYSAVEGSRRNGKT